MTDKPQDLDAMGPGEELDKMIAVEICGWKLLPEGIWETREGQYRVIKPHWGLPYPRFRPSTDRNDLRAAAARLPDGKIFSYGQYGNVFQARCKLPDWDSEFADASTPHVAGCIAMLKAVRAAGWKPGEET